MKPIQKIYATCFLIATLVPLNILAQAPDWEWVRSPQVNDEIQTHSVAADAFGNVYSTGWYYNTDVTFGSIVLNFSPDGDIYIVKYDSSGNVIWANSAGGTGFDETRSIATDAIGNVYVTGIYDGPTLTIGGITLTNTSNGTIDVFVAKFDSAGTLLWAQNIGGTDREFAEQIAIDYAGNVVVAGSFESATLTIGSTTLTNQTPANEDVYIAKYDTDGNVLWAKSASGTGLDWATCVATDPFGNIIIAGPTYSDTIAFDGTLLINPNYGAGSEGTFIVKFDSIGNVVWAKQVNGISYFNELYSVATDALGNVFVSGTSNSDTVEVDGTVLTNPTAGYYDMIFVKFNPTGFVLWAKKTGGYGTDYGYSIATDAAGNAYVVGHFDSDTIYFDATNYVTIDQNFYSDLFIVKYDSLGNVIWSKSTGGIYQPNSYGYSQQGLAINSFGDLFTSGTYQSDPVVFDSDTLFLGAAIVNAFVAKLNDAGECSASFTLVPDSTTLHLYWAINNSSGVGPISYLWSWGDGNTDTTQYPSHTYANAGFYTICQTITDSTGCSNMTCNTPYLQRNSSNSNAIVTVNVVPFIPTGINELEQQPVLIYPNPVTDHFTVIMANNNQKVQLSITDMAGRIVYETTSSANQIEVNSSGFEKGIYVLSIYANGFRVTRKIMVR